MIKVKRLNPDHSQSIQEWEFDPKPSLIRLGRLPDNDIVITDCPEVSRYHAEIYPDQDQWRLINRGANGTFVNGHFLGHNSQCLINHLTLIQLAQNGPVFQFELLSGSQGKPDSNLPTKCTHQNNPPQNLFCTHCGQPIVAQEEFIRQYQILKVLGRGGMGTTYIAWDKNGTIKGHPLLLVLKEMNADMEKIPKANELFDREARILKEVNHPGVPEYYDFFIENNRKYLAMALIHGKNLEQIIYEKGAILPEVAIKWMIKTCDILSHLHGFNPPLVHRDIKPANLMLRTIDQQILLLDFGAVKEIGTPLGTVISSEGYGAPEQVRGQPCIQSDLYAVGSTLIFLLTSGHSPQRYQVLVDHQIKFDLTKIPTLTPELREVIAKVTSQNIGDRHQSALELKEALEKCL